MRTDGDRVQNPSSDGIGFAAGFKNVGFTFGYQENSYARVELAAAMRSQEAVVYFAGADCGQGNHTIIAQMAAEVAGVPFERVRVIASDTASHGRLGQRVRLAADYMSGNAVRGAAGRRSLRGKTRIDPRSVSTSIWRPRPPRSITIPARASPISPTATSRRRPSWPSIPKPGEVRVERFVERGRCRPGHQPPAGGDRPDRGRAWCRRWATRCWRIADTGRARADRQAQHLPDPDRAGHPRPDGFAIIVEVPDPNGPFGARGMGEMPYLAGRGRRRRGGPRCDRRALRRLSR